MKNISLQKGFTLVEMIVALAIFTIVAMVAVGALLKITDANRKSLTLKTTINNLNFALESMSREIRVGADYYITNNISEPIDSIDNPTNSKIDFDEGSWLIAFSSSKTAPDGEGRCRLIYAYKYLADTYTIEKSQQQACGENIQNNFQPLVSSDIKITNTIVSVDGTAQPKVFLWLKGYSGVRERERTEFSIQTSISYGK